MSDEQSIAYIRAKIRAAREQHGDEHKRIRARRALVLRSPSNTPDNLVGTYLPAPFDKTSLAIKTVIGETSKAVQNYAGRIAANPPKIVIEPLSAKNDISATVEKHSAEQERIDMALWSENGGDEAQWTIGMHMTVGAVGYYLTLPRDAGFGVPDRLYYEQESEDELRVLKDAGKVTPYRVMRPGKPKLVYAEPADVWAERRKKHSRKRAESGRSLFTLEALPRDQVIAWRDIDGIKEALVVREIPGEDCAPGSDMASRYARTKGMEPSITDSESGQTYLYGIWADREGRIVGGYERGGPPDSSWQRPNSFVLIQYFNRLEQVVLISGLGYTDGAVEVWRGKHGCNIQGIPACPIVEVPMMHTGINVPGAEFTTPMEPVFAYAPIINQLMTILSNASAVNGIPRWVIEDKEGNIRGEDGEPKVMSDGEFVPGLDPRDAMVISGTLRQVLVDTKSMQDMLAQLMERLDAVMPAPVTSGEAGSSAAAWQVRLRIQQAQELLRQPVNNHASAVRDIVQMWHGWMRSLGTPVYFFAAPGARSSRRTMRGLIEFDPKDLTDAISVTQDLDTADEATVLLQQGIELHQAGYIDIEEFYEKYARSQDSRDSVKRKYKQEIWQYLWTGALPPLPPGAQPGELPMVKIIGDGIRGRVFYELIQKAPHYAEQVSRDLAAQAQAPMGGDVAGAAGIVEPGMGMAPTLPDQLGAGTPGGMAPPSPVVA